MLGPIGTLGRLALLTHGCRLQSQRKAFTHLFTITPWEMGRTTIRSANHGLERVHGWVIWLLDQGPCDSQIIFDENRWYWC